MVGFTWIRATRRVRFEKTRAIETTFVQLYPDFDFLYKHYFVSADLVTSGSYRIKLLRVCLSNKICSHLKWIEDCVS